MSRCHGGPCQGPYPAVRGPARSEPRQLAPGWETTGDALLANAAADQARKRRQAGRDQLADEYGEAIASEAA